MVFIWVIGSFNLLLTVWLVGLIIGKNFKLNNIMAKIQDISAKADQLQADLDRVQELIKTHITNLDEVIADLQKQLADGGTEAERQAVLDKLNVIQGDLLSTFPGESEPAPPTT